MGRFRTWMVGRARDFLGISQLHQQLRETNELLRHVGLALSARPSAHASSASVAADDSPAALQSLANGALFVVGCARSGTTILTRCLNCAPQIMLLEEPLFFLHQDVADFARFFNERQAAMGTRRQKGSFVAPAMTPEVGPLGLLCRLHGDHRYVGEKVAFGPQEFPPDWCFRYLDFQSKYFLHSRYILIARTPVEAVWSMHKMFPERPIPRLFETWLRSTALLLDAYQLFARCRVVFFDHLDLTLIDRLSQWLEVPITVTAGTIARHAVRSTVPPGELPESLLAFEPLCIRATAIFDDLKASFSPSSMDYSGPINRWDFFFSLHQRIEELLGELAAPSADETPRAARFVLRGWGRQARSSVKRLPRLTAPQTQGQIANV